MSSRKSTSGYFFMLGGGAISWASRKQTVVATSTCEAEYIAMRTACKVTVWLLRGFSFVLKNETDLDSLRVIADS